MRVLIVELPGVMRGIIRDLLAAEPEIDIVAETTGDVDLPTLVHATRADVIVMGMDDVGLTAAGERVLAVHPGVRLLGLVADGRDGVMYELRPHRRLLGELSPGALVSALREPHGRGRILNAE